MFGPKKVKILYLSDEYAKNVCGTKISIFKEFKRRGFNIEFNTIHSLKRNTIDGKALLKKLKTEGFTHLFISHTWVEYNGCTLKDINNLGVSVLGFGFSDPYAWKGSKLSLYNMYSTNHFQTFQALVMNQKKPVVFFPTACDVSFHKDLKLPKTTDIIIFGVGNHSRFKPKTYRISLVSKLLKDLNSLKIKVFGKSWGTVKAGAHIEGNTFLKEINLAKISLDLQQDHAPLAHRMFESMACGTVAITKDRLEVRNLLVPEYGILVYNDYDSLVNKIQQLIKDREYLAEIKSRTFSNTIANHNISNRVDHLIRFLEKNETINN